MKTSEIENKKKKHKDTQVSVLRIGYRPVRDDRITTHAALVARALGAAKIYMTGVDISIKETIEAVCKSWGGPDFEVKIIEDWKETARSWRKECGGKIVHLTMYGVNINDAMKDMQKEDKILVVVGAEKVPKETYGIADFNIAIGNQPHSEVAALAVFLDRIFNGIELNRSFEGAKLQIIPSIIGKRVREISNGDNAANKRKTEWVGPSTSS